MPPSVLAPSFRVVRTNSTDPDPALCISPEEMAKEVADRWLTKYMRTREESLLEFTEGRAPAWFYLRRLPAAWIASVIDPLSYYPQQRVMAVRAGMPRVEGPDGILEVVQGPVERPEDGQFAGEISAQGIVLAPMSWVQEIADRFGSETVQEMGQTILDHSRLPKGRRGPFVWWGGTVATP